MTIWPREINTNTYECLAKQAGTVVVNIINRKDE